MEKRLDTMSASVKTIRQALEAFHATLVMTKTQSSIPAAVVVGSAVGATRVGTRMHLAAKSLGKNLHHILIRNLVCPVHRPKTFQRRFRPTCRCTHRRFIEAPLAAHGTSMTTANPLSAKNWLIALLGRQSSANTERRRPMDLERVGIEDRSAKNLCNYFRGHMVSRHREMLQIDFSDEDVDAILDYLYALAVRR